MNKLWFIIGALIIILALAYGGMKILPKMTSQPASQTQSTAKMVKEATSPTTAMQNSVYKMVQKNKVGTVMTDLKGLTLYTYAKDTTGVSTCTGKCLSNWPAYTATSQASSLPADVTVIKRDDGTLQYAWKGMPLYYYVKDTDSEDAYGDGVGGIWSVVK